RTQEVICLSPVVFHGAFFFVDVVFSIRMEDTECLPGNISRKPDIKKQYDGRDYSPPQKWIPDSPGMDEFDSRQFQTFPGPYQTIQILSILGFGQQTHHHTKPHAHPENDSGPVEKGHLRKPHFHSEGKG